MSGTRRHRRPPPRPAAEVHETRAFVARVVDYGESDRIVTLITEKLGKLSALARSARKSRRRFGAALSPYLMISCSLAGRPSEGRLLTLQSCAAAETFPRMTRHVERVSLSAYFTELVRESLADAHPEPRIFALLLDAHRLLDTGPPGRRFVRAFELRLLSLLGFEPRLDQCMGLVGDQACEGPIPSPSADDAEATIYGFDPSKGGVLCPRCAARTDAVPASPVRLSGRAILAMTETAKMTLEAASAARPDLETNLNEQVRSATQAKFSTLIKSELKSVRFITELKRAMELKRTADK